MRFLDIAIRQAHPGGDRGPYRDDAHKLAEAREFQRLEDIPWPVLVDDLAGTVHQTYGGMADSQYLLDVDGRVVFYGMWASVPPLKIAIDDLLARGGRGAPATGGLDRTPHLFASFVDGWRGLRRGGIGGVLDYELAVPGGATLTLLGELAKPVLAPLAQRTTPLPVSTKLMLGGTLALVGALGVRALRQG